MDVTRTHPESPSCNDMAITCPNPDPLPHDDNDVPQAIPPPQHDSNDGILVMPTTVSELLVLTRCRGNSEGMNQ